MPISATSQQEFSDADFRVVDNGDQSKKLAFEVSGIATGTTRTWTVPDADVTVSSFIATLLDDAAAATALTTLGITFGTYTPTLTGVTNIDALTARLTTYIQIGSGAGSVVVLGGQFAIDATTSGAAASFGMSLPVASNFANQWDAGGVASSGASVSSRITADSTNDRLTFDLTAGSAGNQNHNFIAIYGVI